MAVTFDEGGLTDTTACCNEQPGPNWAYPGFSPLLGTPPTTPGADPGGGRVGALLLNSTYIQPGTVDTTGSYNHYSALRSYEDLLGLTSGGADSLGHLGFAAASGLAPFGQDIFQPAVAPTITTNPLSQTVYSGNTLTFSASGASRRRRCSGRRRWTAAPRGSTLREPHQLASRRGRSRPSRTAGRFGPSLPTIRAGYVQRRHHHGPPRRGSGDNDPANQPNRALGPNGDFLGRRQR